jgi:hypothetical protein
MRAISAVGARSRWALATARQVRVHEQAPEDIVPSSRRGLRAAALGRPPSMRTSTSIWVATTGSWVVAS